MSLPESMGSIVTCGHDEKDATSIHFEIDFNGQNSLSQDADFWSHNTITCQKSALSEYREFRQRPRQPALSVMRVLCHYCEG